MKPQIQRMNLMYYNISFQCMIYFKTFLYDELMFLSPIFYEKTGKK